MMELLGTVMKQISDYLGMHEQNNQNNYATFYYQGSDKCKHEYLEQYTYDSIQADINNHGK